MRSSRFTILGATDYTEKGRTFKGLDSASWFENLYGVNRDPYTTSYVRYAYDQGMPLWSDSIAEDNPGYDWKNYQAISAAEGLEVAKAALRYYMWGVDYSMPAKGASKPILGPEVYTANQAAITQWTAINGDNTSRANGYFPGTPQSLATATIPGTSGLPSGWASGLGADSPYAGGSAGSPMPFVRGAVESPREFARSMLNAYAAARMPSYALSSSAAGVDGLGLVTGALAMTSLYNAVENLAAAKPATNLDTYFRTGTKSTDSLRLTREDLEKCALVVPDIRQLRAGDLVLHYGEGEGAVPDPMKIAVVLYVPASGAPTPGTDPTSYLSQVVLLGANEGDRQVRVGTWTGVFGDASRSFHVRRIVRTKPVVGAKRFDFKVGGIAESMLEVRLSTMKVTLGKTYDHSYTGPKTESQRWIPNTGQYLVIDEINVKFTNGNANIDIDRKLGAAYEIAINAKDRNYDPSKANQGNIFNNTGSGFEFVAAPLEGFDSVEPVRIVDFVPQDPKAQYYKPDYSNAQLEYTPEGKLRDGVWFMVLWGRLAFIDTRTRINTSRFGIRPITGKPISPGDDIELSVVVKRRGVYGSSTIIEGSVEEKDYLAIYDKKMLWRANLYIKENANDWNDQYPWNAADNDWNIAGNGKQIPIQYFSAPRQQAANDDNVANRVAYDYPRVKYSWDLPNSDQCIDTPIAFNQKMLQLKAYLAQVYNSAGVLEKNTSAIAWDKTTAPSKKWGNYLNVATSDRALPGVGLLYHDWNVAQGNLDQDLNKDVQGSSGKAFNDNKELKPDHIGTDCIGFVRNTASYPGATYVWDAGVFRRYPSPHVNDSLSTVIAKVNDSNLADELKRIIPGDVIYYGDVGDKGWEGHHIAIVQSTNLTGQANGIKLIEAYFDGTICYVNNSRTLQVFTVNNKKWEIVRLK